jgi:hypothetical protein
LCRHRAWCTDPSARCLGLGPLGKGRSGRLRTPAERPGGAQRVRILLHLLHCHPPVRCQGTRLGSGRPARLLSDIGPVARRGAGRFIADFWAASYVSSVWMLSRSMAACTIELVNESILKSTKCAQGCVAPACAIASKMEGISGLPDLFEVCKSGKVMYRGLQAPN